MTSKSEDEHMDVDDNGNIEAVAEGGDMMDAITGSTTIIPSVPITTPTTKPTTTKTAAAAAAAVANPVIVSETITTVAPPPLSSSSPPPAAATTSPHNPPSTQKTIASTSPVPSTSTSKFTASTTTTPVASVAPIVAESNVLANAGTIPSVTVSLHPLVIMNVSEHWTRIRAQENARQQVIGALIGKQNGRNIEVMNSFELKFDVIDQNIQINREYYQTKESQYKQVFQDLDFLGWYTTGEILSVKDIHVHKQICDINECPIMLQLNPLSRNVDQIPVRLYESIIDIVQGEATMLFVPLTYTLATEEAERIGVDHVVRMSTNEIGEKSVLAEHLVAQHSAIKMLHSRVKLVLQYIKDVECGLLKPNHEILREAYSLSHRLPAIQSSSFHMEYYTQSNDVALITYLGAMTKACNDMNHLVSKFNVLYDRQGMGRRMRGVFF